MKIFDRLAEFRKAWDAVPSQDNEGYVPDRGAFKCGFYAACDILQPEIAHKRDALNAVTIDAVQVGHVPVQFTITEWAMNKVRAALT